MSGGPPDRPEKIVRAILEGARAEVDAAIPPDAVSRMASRLSSALGDGAATAGAAPGVPARGPGTWRAIATHALVGTAAFVSGYAVRAASERPTVRVELRERTVLVPTPARTTERVATREPPHETPSADAGTSPSPRSRGEAGSGLAAEQWWVDRASGALRAGRPADALRSAEEHARRFPNGQLRGLRDVLRAEALAMLDRRDEARTVARQALRRESAPGLRARLEAVLHEEDLR